MPVDARKRQALLREFRAHGSVHRAAVKARIPDAEAAEILRAEGFDLETTDWFFESAASFYRATWKRLHPARTRVRRAASKTLGRLPGARSAGRRLSSSATKTERWLVDWSARHPVKKSVGAFILASLFLSAYWLVDPEGQGVVAGLFLVSFSFGAGLLIVHTRSPRLIGSTGIVLLMSGLYALTDNLGSWAFLGFRWVLFLEAVRATLVPIAGWAFLDAIRQATGFLDRLRVHIPIGSSALTLGLFLSGTALALVELYLVSAYSEDPASIRFVARYGLSYLLWALASVSLLFTHLYLLYLASLTSLGRITTRRIALAMATGVVLLLFVGMNLATILTTAAGPDPGPMRLGINAVDVRAATLGPWDSFVHLEVPWHLVEAVRGRYNWTYYDEQFVLADTARYEVYLLIGTVPPAWFVEEHRDAVMQDQAGRTLYWIDEDPRVEARRIWDLSFASESVVAAKENFTRAVAERYAWRPSVIAVSIQNEPAWPSDSDVFRMASYDAFTVDAFRAWMEDTYGTLDAFNETHPSPVPSWAAVEAPNGAESGLWTDWLRFREDLLTSFVDRLVRAVREETPKPVTVKILAHYLARYSVVQTGLTERVLRSFIEASDVVSLDLYPLTRADMRRSLLYYQGLAGGKPLWITEFNFFLSCTTPGTGSAMYAALVEMSRFAERAIVFTWEPHYLYGLRLYPSVPGLVGMEMFLESRDGRSAIVSYGRLVASDLGAVPNLYGAYVLASAFANLPVVPWPVLVLFLVPVPIADLEEKRRWKRGLRVAALVLLIVATLASNLGG